MNEWMNELFIYLFCKENTIIMRYNLLHKKIHYVMGSLNFKLNVYASQIFVDFMVTVRNYKNYKFFKINYLNELTN